MLLKVLILDWEQHFKFMKKIIVNIFLVYLLLCFKGLYANEIYFIDITEGVGKKLFRGHVRHQGGVNHLLIKAQNVKNTQHDMKNTFSLKPFFCNVIPV